MNTGDIELSGGLNAIGFNRLDTVGAMALDNIATNQTRRTKYSTSVLKEWAIAVDEAYDGAVEIMFTPDRPMVAVKINTDDDRDDARVGIGAAPRLDQPPGGDE